VLVACTGGCVIPYFPFYQSRRVRGCGYVGGNGRGTVKRKVVMLPGKSKRSGVDEEGREGEWDGAEDVLRETRCRRE
jgi:hypothetical protein